ncbi:hypothetical protein DF186_23460, partial [Enterococcus hirae]
LAGVDIHNGRLVDLQPVPDLWQRMLTVSRDEFAELAEQQRSRPASERQYWLARGPDMPSGTWTRSLGSTAAPVALVFPA